MKSTIVVLFLLISSVAVAQTAGGAPLGGTVAETQTMQTAPAVAGSDDYSSSTAMAVAANTFPSAPMPPMSLAFVRPVAAPSQPGNRDFKPFSASKVNHLLVATEFWTRGLDAFSTHRDLNDPCGCYHEGSHFLGLNLTPMMKTTVGAYSYSLGIAAMYSMLSAKLWDAGKDHPRHARLLRAISRTLLVGDSSMEMTVDVRNFTIPKPLNP